MSSNNELQHDFVLNFKSKLLSAHESHVCSYAAGMNDCAILQWNIASVGDDKYTETH